MADFVSEPRAAIQASLEAFNSEEQRRIPCGPGDGSEWDSVKWPKEPQPVDEDSCEPDCYLSIYRRMLRPRPCRCGDRGRGGPSKKAICPR